MSGCVGVWDSMEDVSRRGSCVHVNVCANKWVVYIRSCAICRCVNTFLGSRPISEYVCVGS